jgi:DNA-binding GntR family transcriptional regulator
MYCSTTRAAWPHRLLDGFGSERRTVVQPRRCDPPTAWLLVGNVEHVKRQESSSDVGIAESAVLLEASAIAMGASRITPECISVARAADVAMRACSHDPASASRLARLFHQTLLAACPNGHMLDLLAETSGAVGRSGRAVCGAHDVCGVADDHEAILDLIAAGATASDLERALRLHAGRTSLCFGALTGVA